MVSAAVKRESGSTLAERLQFYSMPEPNSGCWLWLGSVSHWGYGEIRWKKKNLRAHRVSWELANNQAIPDGMFVCHKCDNPGCINPTHLFVGTHQDNVDDMYRKGRGKWRHLKRGHAKGTTFKTSRRGEKVSSAKLTEAAVREIKAHGKAHRFLARKYGVNYSAIKDVLKGRTWKHV
jgi:hypothetical protein